MGKRQETEMYHLFLAVSDTSELYRSAMANYGVVKFIHSMHLKKNVLFGCAPDNPEEGFMY